MDEDYGQLSIAQQGVYHNLRDWAAGQTPRGTFQVRNLESLARAVACGDVELLQSVIEILTTTWRNADGTPHVVITDERGAFTTWEKWQRPPSQEPEAIAERAERYKERNNGNKTVLKQSKNDAVEREVDTESREREIDEIGGGGNTNRAREAPADSAAAVSVELGISDQEKGAAGALRQIVTLSKDHPAENLVALAVDCRNHFQDEGWETWSLGRRMYKFSKWVSREPVLRNEDLAKHPARASPNGVPESIDYYEPTADDLARIGLAAKAETTRREQRRE